MLCAVLDEGMNLLPIAGYEGYLISDCGRVFSDKTTTRRERVVHVGKDGYVRVILARTDLSGYDTKYVHRLVAQAWLPNADGKTDVNHKDMVKTNNCVANLEWVTHRENIMKAVEKLGVWLEGGQNRRAVECREDGSDVWERWPSARAWAAQSGNTKRAANICKALQTARVAYGRYWRFAPEERGV